MIAENYERGVYAAEAELEKMGKELLQDPYATLPERLGLIKKRKYDKLGNVKSRKSKNTKKHGPFATLTERLT
jgi:hypothetical protein